MELYEGKIETLNGLGYTVHSDGNTYIKEQDIAECLFGGNIEISRDYFDQNRIINGKGYLLLDAFIVAHHTYEVLSDKLEVTTAEKDIIDRLYPYILQLAKIGASELEGERKPLEVMEDMIRGNDTSRHS